MLNKERLERWIGALESGEYEKTTGTLREPKGSPGDGYRYCSVGVGIQEALLANEITVRKPTEAWEPPWSWDSGFNYDSFARWLGVRAEDLILDISDMEDMAPLFPTKKGSPVDLNDHTPMTFAELAQGLRKEYL